MAMYNLIGYSSNYSGTTGSLWFHSKDEATNFYAGIANNNNFKSFEFKPKLLENAAITVPLKTFSNFWRSIEMQLINLKNELKLKWRGNCVLTATGAENTDVNPNSIIFTIKNTNFYVPIVTLSAKDNQKLLKLLSKGIKK